MPNWWQDMLEKSLYFMPHGHCYLWIPWLLWLHVGSDLLIGTAYVSISLILWLLVRRIRLPFSPVFIAFGLFIALCGATHYMAIWNVWNADYVASGLLKAATAAASVATAIGLFYVRPQIEAVVHAARLSEERRVRLESTNAELEAMVAKVRELDELKNQFFANVSHELRTPLMLILGPAEQLLTRSALGEAERRSIADIRANGQVLLKHVNDLLDLAKIDFGQGHLDAHDIELAGWFRRICAHFGSLAQQRGIEFTVDVPDRLDTRIDPDKLERVLVNLLSNAFKFTPDGGIVRARLTRDGDTLHMAVDDSGPGVPASQREVIFERFRQAEGGTTRRHGGTGLGLNIAREFIHLHGGHIHVTDAPDGGARFAASWPRIAPEAEAGAASAHVRDETMAPALAGTLQALSADAAIGSHAALPSAPGRPEVLLVEDNAELRAFIAGVLTEHYNVALAVDGHDGLERARALRPDLVITDVMMPRMGGDELVRALREESVFDATPILLLSARADDALRVELLSTGAQDYLTKPFLPQELLARTGNLIAAKRAVDILRDSVQSLSTDLGDLSHEVAAKTHALRAALSAADAARVQAERANEIKGAFLALVSHELRAPLSTLHLNAQLLARQPVESLPVPIRDAISRQLRGSQRLTTLVDGLLEYTRVESGAMEIRCTRVDLAALARDAIEAQSETVPPGVELVLEPPGPLRALDSDPRLLGVVLSNLLTNALKFTQAGTVTLAVSSADHTHTVEVRDTGIGIDAADLERIFEPFEQLEPIKRKSVPGVGLGLALVRQIVHAMHGTIEVESRPGAGTMFRVTLPSRPPEVIE
ncbi:ATP-binding response regulator [Cognatilysobacter bugurensis]|uniref:histidine kinase n=1 Tax=Cognatilysobacter bugurensis TaxID=543356 RepID=A0A918T4K9_9GAMM|nr:ATP-binding protein [Lysobacter bugurensis]GHA83450.1 histidine kinase [Lysobacter bugurensis]